MRGGRKERVGVRAHVVAAEVEILSSPFRVLELGIERCGFPTEAVNTINPLLVYGQVYPFAPRVPAQWYCANLVIFKTRPSLTAVFENPHLCAVRAMKRDIIFEYPT